MKRTIIKISLLISILTPLAGMAYQQPSPKALSSALTNYNEAIKAHQVTNQHYMAIVDFTKKSNADRFFIYDLYQQKVVYSTLVAQGSGSGRGASATHFSNQPGSHMSSLGSFVTTGNQYATHHHATIHLTGLNKGINDNAASRGIMLHDAWYVSKDFAKQNGRVGNSYGCFAMNLNALKYVTPMISSGTLLYAYD